MRPMLCPTASPALVRFRHNLTRAAGETLFPALQPLAVLGSSRSRTAGRGVCFLKAEWAPTGPATHYGVTANDVVVRTQYRCLGNSVPGSRVRVPPRQHWGGDSCRIRQALRAHDHLWRVLI